MKRETLRHSLMGLLLLSGSGMLGCDPPPAAPARPAASLPPGFEAPAEAATPAPEASSEASAESASRQAQVGVGRKGHAYGFDPITQPAATYWRAKEKIAFEIQIPHALQLFKALSPDGRGPDSHEAFLRDIITPNAIELPELPEGLHYRYDPQSETLMVEPKP